MSPFQKEIGNLVTQDKEKPEILSDFFASFFTSKGSNYTAQATEPKRAEEGKRKSCPLYMNNRFKPT